MELSTVIHGPQRGAYSRTNGGLYRSGAQSILASLPVEYQAPVAHVLLGAKYQAPVAHVLLGGLQCRDVENVSRGRTRTRTPLKPPIGPEFSCCTSDHPIMADRPPMPPKRMSLPSRVGICERRAELSASLALRAVACQGSTSRRNVTEDIQHLCC
jgi:hypothetical protein